MTFHRSYLGVHIIDEVDVSMVYGAGNDCYFSVWARKAQLSNEVRSVLL